MPAPTCFISYSWDTEEHKRWVRDLGTALQKNGVKIYLDQWDSHLGMDLTHYMETSIRESDFVVLVCTPNFAKKANGGTGGVGYEKSVVTGEIFTATSSPSKFVPIVRNGTPPSVSLPSYLKSKLYVDFRTDATFEVSLEELLRHIYKSPKYPPPELGHRPPYASLPASDRQKDKFAITQFDAFRQAYEFAYSFDGLNKSRVEAEEFATSWTSREPIPDIELFKLVYTFAYSFSGLNKSRAESEQFAHRWLERFSSSDLAEFRTAFDFAYGINGMNKSRIEAEQYALEVLAARKAPRKC